MKKIVFIITCLILLSCSDNVVQNNCFLGVTLNEPINLNNPEFNNLLVPGGSAVTSILNRQILIIRQGNTGYKAFDLACPDGGCNSSMTFDGLVLTCPCDNKRYSSLNGAPIDENGALINDGSCFALEYNVVETSSTTLQITR